MTVERITRGLVVVSLLTAVAVGLTPYFARPPVAFTLAAILLASAAAARLRFAHATAVVLLLAYVAYGLVRLAAGPALASTPFWLAAFVGLTVGGGPWSTWQAPAPWRVPIAWWALGVAVSWPVVAARETSFAFDNPVVTGTIVGAAIVQMACALWLDTMLAGRGELRHGLRDTENAPSLTETQRDTGAFPLSLCLRGERASVPRSPWGLGNGLLAERAADRDRGVFLLPLAASAVITALAAIYQRFVDITWLSGDPWSRLGRATGMMGDANPMGVVTALMAPLVLAAVLPNASLLRLAALGMALVLWTAAWVSGARSTLILFAAAAIGLALGWAMNRGISLRRVAYAGAAVAALVAVLLVFALPRLPTSSPIARLVATLPAASPGALLYELFWRRDGYGLAAVEAIAEHPLNGVGIGRFSAVAPAYYARVERRAIPPDNAQSLWRHTLAERGLLGLVPVAWLTLLTIAAIGRRTLDPRRALLNTMVAALGVVLMFGYPLQDPAVAATVATLVGMAGMTDRAAGSPPAPRAIWALALGAAVLGAVLDYLT